MNTSYAEKWSRSYKEALKPLTEAEARKLHARKGALYTVLLGDPARPQAFVEIVSGDSIQVEFLDDLLRSYTSYRFVQQPDGRLFMGMAVFREFDGEGKILRRARRFSFRPDGHVMSFETDYSKSPAIETVTEQEMDMSLNWEPYPEFGDCQSIARYERGIATAAAPPSL